MLWGGCKAGVTAVRFQPNHPPTKHGHTDPTLNKEVGPVDRGRVMEDNGCSGRWRKSKVSRLAHSDSLKEVARGTDVSACYHPAVVERGSSCVQEAGRAR